ncbi:MAG: FAD-dependent monooxygenase [Paracoccaceae bacterium]
MTREDPEIAVVGAGIGGLALALALQDRGLPVAVYERAEALAEIGAAIALSANATRELARFGCLPAIEAAACEPTELIYRRWRTQDRVAAHPVREGGAYRARFGASYFGIHRADLQRAMAAQVTDGTLRLGHALSGLTETDEGIRLDFEGRDSVVADIVIGADGIRSRVRDHVAGPDAVRYTGTSAFRGIVPVDRLPSLPDPQAIQFWMGPDAHLLHYAIGPEGGDVNFFAVAEGPAEWPDPRRWVIETDPDDPLRVFAGWDEAVLEMVGQSDRVARWGLFSTKPLRRWHRGRAVIIGDAAHAMLPHHGQGANTSIEDAVTLAELLWRDGLGDLDATLTTFVALRRARTRVIQMSARATNDALHLPDHADLDRRDARMGRFPEEFGWIHAFDVRRAMATPQARLRA